MAEKLFSNVRLGLKVDTLENWKSSSLVLKRGEVAFCTVAATEGNGLSEPVVMMKIGDGEKTFSQLGFDFYAKASDVLAACKTEDGLTAFVNNVIANAGIATSEAMTALSNRVTTAEGEIDTLQSEMDAVEKKAADNETAIGVLNGDASTAGSVAKAIADAIAALNLANTYEAKGAAAQALVDAKAYVDGKDTAMGERVDVLEAAIAADGAVDTKIKNAIDALDVTDTAVAGKYVSAVNEVDGKVVITRADLPDYTETYDAKGAAAQALTDAKAYADGLAVNYDAKGDAAQALVDAKAYADGLATNYDEAGAAESALEAANKYTDDEIAELDLANTYAAKTHTHVKTDITDFAHTHAIGEVNGLQAALDGKQAAGDYATKAEAQGYADAKDEAIEAAQAAADKAQGEVDALETYVGTIPSDEKYADITNVISYINKKSEETLAAAQGGSSETAASVKQQLDNYKSENDTRVGAVEDAIDAINNADTGILKQAKDYADGKDAAIQAAQKAGDDAMAEAQKKVASVTAADASVTIGGTATAPTVAAKLSADADNALTLEDDGLKVVIPAAAEYSIVKAADSGDYAAVYNLTKDGTIVGASINIPKDMVVKSGSVVGDEIVLVLNDEAATEIKIPVASLIEYVTSGSQTGDMVVVTVSDDHKVTATITDGTITLAKLHTDIQTAIGKAHSHENADVLAGINADKVAAWDGAEQNAKDYADGLNTAMNGRVEALEAIDHEHANKTELDKIAEGDVAKWNAAEQNAKDYADGLNTTMDGRVAALEAIDHDHGNKAVLDGITAEKVTAWDGAVTTAGTAVQTVTAGTGLKATKTGTDVAIDLDETVTWVFDCGTSAE